MNWAELVDGFILTFSFEYEIMGIDSALQVVKDNIFEGVTTLTWKKPNLATQIEYALECYKIIVEEEEYLRNIDIADSEGHREVQGPEI